MPVTVKDMVAAAAQEVAKIDPSEAARLMDEEGGLLLDVRDAPELERSGRAKDAHHIPRGMLEFRTDPDSPAFDSELQRDRPIILYCAAGGRAALAGKALKELGYQRVFTIGSFKDWIEGGGEVSEGMDPGM
ncbi:MAG: rhodanese-like domain-containing protein [Rhodobacteraceae bacterium]|nr:rhodanese-like domain-containing protein [Paracoccaceae bacterium]